MHALIACSTVALAVTLAVRRPHLGSSDLRVSPAAAAVAGTICLLLAGTVRIADLAIAIDILWRPVAAIGAIMITTAAAQRVGLIDAVAHRILATRVGSVRHLFRGVFVLSLVTASILTNDAAVLLLTPLVVVFIRRHYPDDPRLLVPFAFAVFMAAGVAPFVTSNPMNMVVASYAGLDLNLYAAVMLPVSVAGSVVTFVLLDRLFAADLASATPAHAPAVTTTTPATITGREGGAGRAFTDAQKRMLLLLLAVTATYPLVAAFDGSAIWAVAGSGAMLALGLAWYHSGANPVNVLRRGVAWDVLIFLPAVFVLSIGLRNVGLVDLLSVWYRDASPALIGVTAAIGSAALNNHPMALVNMLALDVRPDAGSREFFAALIGGDLGPRLLPTGSLAGLLWLESCRRLGVHVSAGRFVAVGTILTVPTLALSLALLALF